MTTSRWASEAPLFHLSRLGATSRHGELELEADLHHPSGPGLRLATRSDELDLHLWVNEATWCTWLDPKLATPSLAQVEESLHPLLASWTLAPLDEWLQAQGLPPLAPATLSRAEAPTECWRLTLGSEGRRLPLYLDGVPPALLQRWLTALTPNVDRLHEFGLLLGWCQLPEEVSPPLEQGEALPLHGMGETPDRFWLHPLGGAQLQLFEGQLARALPGKPLAPPPVGTQRLMVEAGRISLDATTLAHWAPDLECAVQLQVYPALRLLRESANRRVALWAEAAQWYAGDDAPWAEGTLLRMDDGWAVRLLTQPAP